MMESAQKPSWYVRRVDLVRGPYPPGQISRETLLGRIRPGDELSADRRVWQSIHELPDLIPPVMRLPHTPENHERLMLARLREDERRQDRRNGHGQLGEGDRRRGDRRNVESFATEAFLAHATRSTDATDERNPLLTAAMILIVIFTLVMYWFGS